MKYIKTILLLLIVMVFSAPRKSVASATQPQPFNAIDTQDTQKASEPQPSPPLPHYRWPLDINNGYSSSFQEFRSSHFHAGFDLRTFQKNGWPVYAVASGHIVSMIMDNRNTGRSLFLRHDDGYLSVYYHLERFESRLEAVAETVKRIRGKKYFGEYELEEPIPFNTGDIIAYSGESGVGFPHLHMEIRDSEGNALNPFQILEFPAADSNPPSLSGIILRNREAATVNGEIGETRLRFTRSGPNQFQINETAIISAPFDILLQAYDLSDTRRFVAPYAISAHIDNKPFFAIQFDKFSLINDNHQLGFVYDLQTSSPTTFHFNLFSQQGFTLEQNRMDPAQFINALTTGPHLLRIHVRDNFGNYCSGTMPFYKVEPPKLKVSDLTATHTTLNLIITQLYAPSADQIEIRLKNAGEKTLQATLLNTVTLNEPKHINLKGAFAPVHFADFHFLKNGISYARSRYLLKPARLGESTRIEFNTHISRDDIYIIPKNPFLTPQNTRLTITQGSQSLEVPPCANGNTLFFHFKPPNTANPLTLKFTLSEEGRPVAQIQEKMRIVHLIPGTPQSFQYGEFSAEFPARAVLEPKVMLLEDFNPPSAPFPIMTPPVSLLPNRFPYVEKVYYSFTTQLPNPAQVGIFLLSPKSKHWRYRPTQYDPETFTYRTAVQTSGIFTLMRDDSPPKIRMLPAGTKWKKTLKELIFRITDAGKGLNDDSLKVTINGTPVEADYDPDWRRAAVTDVQFLKKGKNIIRVEVEDHGKNRAAQTYTLNLK